MVSDGPVVLVTAIHRRDELIAFNDGLCQRLGPTGSDAAQISIHHNHRLWLVVPKIGEQIAKELAESTSPYTIYVAPLLLETNSQKMCSRVLVVDVPKEIQIQRTAERDKVSEIQIEKIVAVQMEREERLEKADDVLVNTGTIKELEEQVVKLHQKYLEMVE